MIATVYFMLLTLLTMTCSLVFAMYSFTIVSKLDPKLSNDDLQDLLKTSLTSVVSCTLEDNASSELTALLDRSLSVLSGLLLEVVAKDMTVATFELILQVTLRSNMTVITVICYHRYYFILIVQLTLRSNMTGITVICYHRYYFILILQVTLRSNMTGINSF